MNYIEGVTVESDIRKMAFENFYESNRNNFKIKNERGKFSLKLFYLLFGNLSNLL